MKNYGCLIKHGGKHKSVVHKESGTVIPVPIPSHGNNIGENYIKQLKKLIIIIEGK